MRLLANHPLPRRLLAGLALSAGLTGLLAPAASAATAESTPGTDGWIRHAKLVLHHVAYGTVSSYMKVAPGEYTVAMREAGASPGSAPVLSTTVQVVADGAYTVAAMGPPNGVRLQVLRDRLETPTAKILIRVIQASHHQHRVTVTAGKEVLASNLAFGNLTSYRVANPGTWTFRAAGDSEHTSRTIKLVPDCIHTIVILDDPGHLKIDDLLDSAGSTEKPGGGVETGLGGTAPAPPRLSGSAVAGDSGRRWSACAGRRLRDPAGPARATAHAVR